MRVIVCGSRTFDHKRRFMWETLDGILLTANLNYMVGSTHGLTVFEGGARGADAEAAEWCDMVEGGHPLIGPLDVPFEHVQVKAKWDAHGRGAGPLRNIEMLQLLLDSDDHEKFCYAWVDKPLHKSVGTYDMVRRAEKAGVTTVVTEVAER